MATTDLRTTLYRLLMDQALGCRFPSPPMLDRLEAAIRDAGAGEDYVRTLIDMMSQERFSSPTMLDRVSGLINVLERV